MTDWLCSCKDSPRCCWSSLLPLHALAHIQPTVYKEPQVLPSRAALHCRSVPNSKGFCHFGCSSCTEAYLETDLHTICPLFQARTNDISEKQKYTTASIQKSSRLSQIKTLNNKAEAQSASYQTRKEPAIAKATRAEKKLFLIPSYKNSMYSCILLCNTGGAQLWHCMASPDKLLQKTRTA